MVGSRFRTDPTTEERLGPQVLEDLRVNLWPVDCQTCGSPLGRWGRPALEVQAEGGFAAASLHHRRCRPPAWVDGTVDISGRRHLTWRAGCFVMQPGNVPTFLINPSYEYALLREGDAGEWQIATLEPYKELGFQPGLSSKQPLPSAAGVSASIDEGFISVDVRHDGAVLQAWHDVYIPPDIARAAHRWGDIMVAVTTLMDVSKPFTIEGMSVLLGTDRVAVAKARLTSVSYPRAAQQVKPGDDESDHQVEAFAISAESIRRALDFTVDDRVLAAAFALCDGKAWMIGQLTGRDKMAALLMVSSFRSLGSRDESGGPARCQGVHLITPDAESADEHMDFFSAVAAEGAAGTVGRLGASPLSDEGSAAYLADIVLGTADEYAAAFTAYSDAGPDWDLHASRGHSAIVTDTAKSDLTQAEFLRHYPKAIAIAI